MPKAESNNLPSCFSGNTGNQLRSLLVLTNSHALHDPRILRQVNEIAHSKLFKRIYVHGINLSEGSFASTVPPHTEINDAKLWCLSAWRLSGKVRQILVMSELFIRHLVIGLLVRPSVVHAHDVMVLPQALLISALTRAKLIYDAHELESNKGGSNWISSRISKAIERVAWPFLDLFITVSPAIMEWYRREFGSVNGIVVINAPKLSERQKSNADNSDIRSALGIGPADLLFVYVGYLGPGRMIEEWIKIFTAKHRTAHLAFLGYGKLQHLCERASEEAAHIHFHSAVRHDELVNFIESADYGVCTIVPQSLSDRLCLPNKLLEYLNAGLSVICSDLPEFLKIVRQNKNGYILKASDSLEELICEIESMGPPAKILPRPEYTWNYQSSLFLEEYHKTASPR